MPTEKELGPELEIVDPDAAPAGEPVEPGPAATGGGSAESPEPAAPPLDVEETESSRQAREKAKKEEKPQGGSQMMMLLAVFAVIFIMLNPSVRGFLAIGVGYALDPVVAGALGRWPVLVLFVVGVVMVGLSTVVRHFFIDWLDMARVQNTMRAFQKEFRDARASKDNARIQRLTKLQPEMMQLQAKLSGGQMKPMVATMVVVIPLFAWLWQWISHVGYPYFATPWNEYVYMYGATVLPHWILLYSLLTIPFGQLVQKGLKVWSWRHRIREINARAA